jgi:hypothetical protein
MPKFKIEKITPHDEDFDIDVIDYDNKKRYSFPNDERESAISIFTQTHHDKSGVPLKIESQKTWLINPGGYVEFDIEDIEDSEWLKKQRDLLDELVRNDRIKETEFVEKAKTTDGGRRRRSIPKSSRKFKKSSKRVFRKKSRSTRRR